MTDSTQQSKEIDIHEVLAERGEVAHVWSIDDVQIMRPDLTDDQAWEVLTRCLLVLDSDRGFTWTLIEDVAQELFPEKV